MESIRLQQSSHIKLLKIMLGVSQLIVQKIALQKVEHSWLLPLMKLPAHRIEQAEENLYKWISQQSKDKNVVFLLQRAIAWYLEWVAIDSYTMEHPSMMGILPVTPSAMEALDLINMDRNWEFKESELKQAAVLLEKMKNGTLKPEVRTLLR